MVWPSLRNRDSRQTASASPSFRINSAIISPSAGPCLKPCPEPPPSSQTFSIRGWRSTMKLTVGSLLVLADASLDQRSVFHRRKAEGDIFANALQRCRADHSLAIRRIERAAARVIGDLKAATVAARDAVEETLAVIAPHWKMRVGEARISGGWAEEKNILLGGANDALLEFQETASPATARKRRRSDRL